MKIWREGDRSRGVCEQCRRLVETRFELRPFPLTRPPIKVRDVLVASCVECGSVVAVPPQSSPRINAAREAYGKTFEVRIAKELDDVLARTTNQFAAVPNTPLRDALLGHYLEEFAQRPEFARRVEHLAKGGGGRGRAEKRLKLRLSERLVEQVSSRAKAAGISNRALMQALIAAMAEDIKEPEQKQRALLKISPAAGAIFPSRKK